MRFAAITLAFILCLSVLVGCRTLQELGIGIKHPSTGKHKGKGPPPHAPAHGYRHKHHDGIELEYDSGLGVYISVELPGVYFYNDLYLRLSGEHWEVAARFDGPWRPEAQGQVPFKLKNSKGAKPRGRGKARGRKNK